MGVGVVGNPAYDDIRDLLSRLASLASRLNLSVYVESGLVGHWPGPVRLLVPDDSEQDLDPLIPFGGDGTLLRGARLLAHRTRRGQVPKRLVRFEKERFFERVRSKLQWGDLSGREVGKNAQ